MSIFDIGHALKQLPAQPGVYRMYDGDNTLIYVGKAKVLKNRVRSYFVGSHTPKVAAMVAQIAHFDYLVTQSEVEALILEANLIKANLPRYNILLRDDKKYPWIALSDEAFPRLYVTRSPKKNGKTKYFGPYVSSGDLYTTLQAVKRHFPLRQRRKPLFKTRPCMNFFIGTCLAPCQKKVTPEAYAELVHRVELFLKGRGDTLKAILQTEMLAASEALNFEHAARLRDTMQAVNTVIARQRVFSHDNRLNWDVITVLQDNLGLNNRWLIGVVLQLRGGKLIASRTHRLHLTGEGDTTPEALLTAFMLRHYDGLESTLSEAASESSDFPDAVVLPPGIDDETALTLCQWLGQLAGRHVQVGDPTGEHQRDLLAMARRNAEEALKQAEFDDLNHLQNDPTEVLMELQTLLDLPDFPHRIECFDISHFQGSQTVASMVVFEGARPAKAEYRRFKITCAEGKPDDFASMHEVIARRFAHSRFAKNDSAHTQPVAIQSPETLIEDLAAPNQAPDAWPDPDLLIIDGGKGQLSAACDALATLGFTYQPVVSLAKKFEEVFKPGESRPVVIARDSRVMFLLQQIRDEAHRFAITYHRQLRGKVATQSLIEQAKGLGKANKQKLMAHYGSVDNVLSAQPEDVAHTLGISIKRVQGFLTHLKAHQGQ
jgi:excinuclease ABC subunit C